MNEQAIRRMQWETLSKALGFEGDESSFDEILHARRGQYPVYCAWCEEKGRKTLLRWSKVPHSHGMCEDCRREMLKGIGH